MRELDPSIFSQDHGWRSIVAALNEASDDLNPFRRVALVKYSEKQAQLNGNGKAGDVSNDNLSGTLILESTLFEPEKEGKNEELERMPKGEVICLQVPDGKEIDICLSKHHCKLTCKDGVGFIDQENRRHPAPAAQLLVRRQSVES